ncbi:MAG: LTA synthase family protein, partial [Prevotella sp.]|nr:LTA synthase family protein [Prevotella sp.]
LDSLYNHSLAFTNFYSAGIHTNHGITATLYSFPALMKRNLMKGTVTPHRSGIPTVLKQQGYHNLFFMTHESQYDNMNAFFHTNGYDEIYAEENYPTEERVNSFGVPDKYLFDYALPVINKTASTGKPFMATLLTISNHPPYIIPKWMKTKTKDPETQIVEYADWCIGRFLSQAKQQPWYDNTIFVILADHGKLVGKMDMELPQSYNHIPLIVFGPGIQPMTYEGLGTQIDVMPTLLGLMNIEYDYDGFGIDLLRQQRDQVFYTSDTHIVARDSSACFIYNPSLGRNFYYDIQKDGRLQETGNNKHFESLRDYVFSMVQTAELMQRQKK